jgi:hypothetical protein
MSDAPANPKSAHVKAGIGSAVALLVFGLGVYALAQGILQRRLVFVVESVVPIIFGGWALRVLVGYWMAVRKGGA